MRYPRIAAGDRREVRTARTIVGSVTHRGTCHGRRPDREADRTERGYQYRGARGGGGFSARGAAETITATLQDGARGDGRQLAGVLAEDLTGRGTDVASGRSGCLTREHPRERLVGAIQWSQFWTRHGGGRDPRGTRQRAICA